MTDSAKRKSKIQQITLGAVLTAIVIVLQLLGSFIRFGTFSISLVLIPIVIGAATCGKWIGAWLGLVFGIVVLASGDAAPFMSISIVGTVITVLLKGALCGLAAGAVYELIAKRNRVFASIAAAIVCPVVNTAVFVAGCFAFFLKDISSAAGDQNVFAFIIVAYVGLNFFFELGTNILLNPIIIRVLNIWKKTN